MKTQEHMLAQILAKVLHIESYIEEHMVTREEFTEFRSEIYSRIDGVIKLYVKLDTEVAALGHAFREQRV